MYHHLGEFMNNFVIAACVSAGFLLVVGGLFLLATQKFVTSPEGITSIKIPLFGRLKTNYPSLVAMFLGASLLVYVVHAVPPPSPSMAHVTGKITSPLGTRQLIVMIAPTTQKTFTNSNGTFEMDVPADVKSYTGIAYDYKDPMVSDSVEIADGHGKFDVDTKPSP